VRGQQRSAESDAFHAAQGFAEVGKAAIHQGSKTVRYLTRAIDLAPASA
jgi:predicted GNAT superfamily acetyltransferase